MDLRQTYYMADGLMRPLPTKQMGDELFLFMLWGERRTRVNGAKRWWALQDSNL
jgi:hypothetical protein